jgi:DNA-directed RNA polymerase subunit RPC12/RpoP
MKTNFQVKSDFAGFLLIGLIIIATVILLKTKASRDAMLTDIQCPKCSMMTVAKIHHDAIHNRTEYRCVECGLKFSVEDEENNEHITVK